MECFELVDRPFGYREVGHPASQLGQEWVFVESSGTTCTRILAKLDVYGGMVSVELSNRQRQDAVDMGRRACDDDLPGAPQPQVGSQRLHAVGTFKSLSHPLQ